MSDEHTLTSRWFPHGFRSEGKALFKLGWPTSLSILFHQLLQPICLMFCGRIGDVELSTAAMALSVIYIECVSIGRGLAFGEDTFFSQTYGSINKKKMGVYLQTGFIFGIFASLFITALLLNTETLLLLLHQPPHIARYAQEFCLYFSPGSLAYCWLFSLMRYMLCQNQVLVNLVVSLISCAINCLLNYVLIDACGLGLRGAAIALAATYYLAALLLILYLWLSGIYKETWPGWSLECLQHWKPFARVIISSIVMTFIFWLCTECGTFLAGILGEMQISAFSIMFQVEGFLWMIPIGLGGACTARIGQYLGAKQPLGAVTVCRVALVMQVSISVSLAALVFFTRNYIPMLFTSNRQLIDYTAQLMPILALFILFEGFGGVGVGIVRGTGRQALGTVIIFVSYYVLALPVGIPLMFLTNLGLAGIWWGFVLGLASQDIFLIAFVTFINWQKEAELAQIRAGVSFEQQSPRRDGHQVEAPAFHTSHSTNSASYRDPLADERTPLMSQSVDASLTSNPPGYEQLVDYTHSTTRMQLVCSRFFVLIFFVAILVAGIFCYVFIHVPVPYTPLCLPDNYTEQWAQWWLANTTTLLPCNITTTAANTTYATTTLLN